MSESGHGETRREQILSAALSRPDDLLHRNILLLRGNTGTRPMLSFDGLRGPRAPPAGPQEDDGKCAPYPSCPQLTRCFQREVDGRRHRSSQIQLDRLARVQANAEADCANPPRAYLRVRSRCCTKKPRSYP